MITAEGEIVPPNGDYRDWILFKIGEDGIYDESKFEAHIVALDNIQRVKYRLALEEMLMNGSIYHIPKTRTYLLTSLGQRVKEAGSFSCYSPSISPELNLNEKFSKNVKVNNNATRITVGVAIGTLIALIIQVLISAFKTTDIEGKVQVQALDSSTLVLLSLLKDMRHQSVGQDSLSREYHRISMKLDSTSDEVLNVVEGGKYSKSPQISKE
jgi:hypothetical protein